MVEAFNMTSDLPEDLDVDSPPVQALLATLTESQRNNFLAMAKDPGVRRMSSVSNAAMAKYWDEVLHARERGKKVAFIPFNCSPEIFHALDIVPVGVEVLNSFTLVLEEGIHEYLDLAVERGLPDTSKIFEYMSEKWDIPAIYLDVPYSHDRRAIDYYTEGYREVVEALQELSGNKLDEDRLREACGLTNKCTEIIMEINDMKRQVPNPVPNYYNLNHLAQKLMLVGTPEALDFYEAALAVCKERMEKGLHVLPEEKIRFMMMYTGIYFDQGLHHWFQEEMGVTYVMDLLVFYDFNPIIDTTNTDTMLSGLAEGMLSLPMTRQLKGSWDMPANWLEDLLYYVDTYKADCIAFTGHAACKQVWGIYRIVADEVRKQLGVPSLRLEGDGWDSRVTSLDVIKEQFTEFFETLA
jgi:hypothetical protein